MKKEIPNPYGDKHCFYWGSDNLHGLRLKFYRDEDTGQVSTECVSAEYFISQGNILYGNIQMGLLDEIMGWTSYLCTGAMTVTAELVVKFIRPVYLGSTVRLACKVTRQEYPRVHLSSLLANAGGVPCASARGMFHAVSSEDYRNLIQGKEPEKGAKA